MLNFKIIITQRETGDFGRSAQFSRSSSSISGRKLASQLSCSSTVARTTPHLSGLVSVGDLCERRTSKQTLLAPDCQKENLTKMWPELLKVHFVPGDGRRMSLLEQNWKTDVQVQVTHFPNFTSVQRWIWDPRQESERKRADWKGIMDQWTEGGIVMGEPKLMRFAQIRPLGSVLGTSFRSPPNPSNENFRGSLANEKGEDGGNNWYLSR